MSPRGVDSDTELPPLSFVVGCRQIVKLVRELVPFLEGLPECTGSPRAAIRGGFQSQADVVRVTYSLLAGSR